MMQREPFCRKPWDNFLVEVNGDCYFCCFIVRPGGKIGNLKKDPFEKIWTSPKATLIRKSIIRGKIPYYCQVCPVYGEYKPENQLLYKIYFLMRKTLDAIGDFCQAGLTRHRIRLKLRRFFHLTSHSGSKD